MIELDDLGVSFGYVIHYYYYYPLLFEFADRRHVQRTKSAVMTELCQ